MAVIIFNKSKDLMTTDEKKGISYITRRDKIINEGYINCEKETAVSEFNNLFLTKNNKRKDSNVYFHIKQTFDPNDSQLTVEKAIACSKELANHYGDLGYQVVYSTHNDTDNIHNHIIVSATNIYKNKTLNSDGKELKRLQNLNDFILKKHGLITREELKKENRLNKNVEYKDKSNKVYDKEIIKLAIEDLLYNKKIKTIENLFYILKKDYKIDSILRGKTLTFIFNNVKYRSNKIDENFFYENLKDVISNNKLGVNKENKKINDTTSNIKYLDDLNTIILNAINSDYIITKDSFDCFLKQHNIQYSNCKKFLVRENEKVSLQDLKLYDEKFIDKRFNLKQYKNFVSNKILSIKANDLEELFLKIKKVNYIEDVYIKNNVLYFKINGYTYDSKLLGKGNDYTNPFSLNSFIRRIQIEGIKNNINDNIQSLDSYGEMINFISTNYEIGGENKNLYIIQDSFKFNLNRILNDIKFFGDIDYKNLYKKILNCQSKEDLYKLGISEYDSNTYIYNNKKIIDFKIYDIPLTPNNVNKIFDITITKSYEKEKSRIQSFLNREKKTNQEYKDSKLTQEQIEAFRSKKSSYDLFKSDFYRTLKYCSNIDNLKEQYDIVDEDKYVFVSLNENSLRLHKDYFYSVIHQNNLVSTFYQSLKECTTIDDFYNKFYALGVKEIDFKSDLLFIDGKKLFNFDDVVININNITERINRNYDRINGTQKSEYYLFKKRFIDTLKKAHKLSDFNNEYFEAGESAIYYKVNDDKIKDTTEYNFANNNFYSFENIKKILDEKETIYKKNRDKDITLNFTYTLLYILASAEDRYESNRQTSKYMKYLREKRAFLRKQNTP